MIDEKLQNALKDPRVEMFFVPTPFLRRIVAEGTHPAIANMVDKAKADLLSGHGIAMESQMVIDYLNNQLDDRFAFILKHSEIRILGAEEILLKVKQRNTT